MTQAEVFTEFGKARTEFLRIFHKPAKTAGPQDGKLMQKV